MVDNIFCNDLEQVACRCYACLAGSKCVLGLHAASPLLELRIVRQIIARLISAWDGMICKE